MSPPARRVAPLESVWVDGLPEVAVPAFEAALEQACGTVGYFRDEDSGLWRVEGVREAGHAEGALQGALALAAAVSGLDPAPALGRGAVEAEGWLARTVQAFPEMAVGARILVRPTHLPDPWTPGRLVLRLDAGVAFGTGEHGSTRGCLLAFGRVAARRPRRLLDLGAGSGILAIAAAKALRRPVLATDIEPWSVRVAADNARQNGVAPLVRSVLADGWRDRRVRAGGPYDLVFANILARPLCAMARDLAANLAPGGTAILAGLLRGQARWVLAAHRRHGLVLERRRDEGAWTTLVLRRGAG